MDRQNSEQTMTEILFQKRCRLYVALAMARGMGNQSAAHDLLAAIERYAENPQTMQQELRERGLIDWP